MFNKTIQKTASTESGRIPYGDQIIIAMLLVIIIAVPLFFDIHLHSVFDLSKITILYVLTFSIITVWSVKTITTCDIVPRPSSLVSRPSSLVPRPSSLVPRLLNQPLTLPILAFLFVTGFATVFSINPYLSLVGTYKRYDGFLSTIVYVLLYFIIIRFIDKKRSGSLVNVIILTACLSSVYGILQHFGFDLYRWSTSFGYGIRVSATFGHPAFFSAFLIMTLPLILMNIFSDQAGQSGQTGSNFRYPTPLYMGILVLVLVAFYYTKTRASFLGLLVSNIFFFTLIGKRNLLAHKARTFVTIIIITGISIFFTVSDRTSAVGRFLDDVTPALTERKEASPFLEGSCEETGIANKLKGSAFLRAFQYMTGLKITHDYPVLGIGPDTLGMIYPQYLAKVYRETGESREFKNQNRIHNDFLDMAVTRGLSGLAIYLWFIVSYARMVWKGCRAANEPDRIHILGLCAGCLAYFIQNQFSFGHIPILTLFWFLLAMSVIACRPKQFKRLNRFKQFKRCNGRAGKRILCAIIVCFMSLLIILSLIRYRADIYFEQGRRSLNRSQINEAIHCYELAVKNNPLALNYCNVLNGIYLKLAEMGVNRNRKNITGQTALFSRKQTAMWLAKAIDGAEQVQKLYPRDYHSAFTLGQAYHILDKLLHAGTPLPGEPHSRPDSFDRQPGEDEDMGQNAIKYYKKAIMLHPFKYELRNKLAQIYEEKGQHDNAILQLKEAMNISPSNQASYLNLARVFINDRERYEEAEDVLLKFIRKNPDKEIPDVYRLLSFISAKTAKWEKVLEQSNKIFQIDQNDLEAQKYAIMASFKLKRYEDARKLCNHMLTITGNTNNTYNKYAKEMLALLSEK